jgi:hypothetical protein
MVTAKGKAKKKRPTTTQREFIVDDSGRTKAVILPIREYERLLEDLHDLATIEERKDETSIPWEDVKARLKADGLI